MVNLNMFKDAFKPQEVEVVSSPTRPTPQYQYEDPDVARFRFMMLKWLTFIVGGSAILLVIWRVALKFIG